MGVSLLLAWVGVMASQPLSASVPTNRSAADRPDFTSTKANRTARTFREIADGTEQHLVQIAQLICQFLQSSW